MLTRSQIGRYRVIEKLGEGGMGEVYLAFDPALQRRVAIKLLRDNADGDHESARRVRREAQAAAALDHANICAVYEVGTDQDGQSFIAMQYVDGETLASRLQRGPLSVAAATDLISGLADALEAAHSRGVVHRDLKPQNIVVTPSGSPKLLDFGVARVRPGGDSIMGEMTTHLSSADIAGTPAYMAPEVLQGQEADARSDLFSLGVVLYECLAGVVPFQGATPHEVWGRVLHVEPDAPSRRNPAVSPELDEVCQRLLAKQPQYRFQSAAEVRGALQVLRTQTRPPPARVPARRRILAVAAATLVVMLAAGASLWLIPDSTLPQPPAAAASWYERGIDAVRQGAYVSGRRALEEAVRLFPGYALAHSRLAEVHSALDDERSAQAALIRVSVLVPDQSRLPKQDRLRFDAIRAMVLREFDRAVAAYTELARLTPQDGGALVDLGRAHEAAGQLTAARGAYEQAIRLDDQSASGHLRLGSVLGNLGDLSGALRAFDEAERLYTVASNDEGRVETLLQRASTLDAAGRSAETARAAEEAGGRAKQAGLLPQELRSEFVRASVLVGRGNFADGEASMRRAVDRAMSAGLQGIAADGLIDMAGTLLANGRTDESDQALERAIGIATDRSLTRTAMRGVTQRAALKLQNEQPREALDLLATPLAYFERFRYRRLEAVALTIAGRAYQQLGEYRQATEPFRRVLAFATESRNGELTAQARSSLATLAASEGQLVKALEHRTEALRLRRQLGDAEILPYDLTNQAEVLIRLGRDAEAEPLLKELETGIASGGGAFSTRRRRVALLRALLAMTSGRYGAARELAAAVDGRTPRTDETGQFAVALAAAASGILGSRHVAAWPEVPNDSSPGWREVRLWRAIALLETGRFDSADAAARALFTDGESGAGAEFEWRASAVSALAAGRRGSADAPLQASRSLEHFERLRADWGPSILTYEHRADVSRMLDAVRTVAAPMSARRPG